MRWRLIDPSILKTERPPVTCARSKSYCGRRNRPTAPPALPRKRVRSSASKRTSANVSRLSVYARTNPHCLIAVAHEAFRAAQPVLNALGALTRPPAPRLRQNNPTGKFSLSPSGKSLLGLAPSCPRGRGVGHRHRTLGWDAVDAAVSGVKFVRRAVFRERATARRTYDAKAYGEVVWS